MTVALDFITHRNLILVKQIYQRAVVQSSSLHSDVDKILSLISFDLANETLLKNSVSAVDGKADTPSDLSKLIEKADGVFASATPPITSVPDSQKVKRVRRIRNGAMHEAKYPTDSDISDCRTYTRDFLQQLVLNVWGEDFNAIRMTDLIKHPTIKEHLITAETKLNEGKNWDAMAEAVAGFGLALGQVKAAVFGKTIGEERSWLSLVTNKEVIILPIIGLDFPSYIQYKRRTQNITVVRYGDGSISSNRGSSVEPSEEDTTFVLNYAVNSVIQIESLVGDIDKPFDI